MLVLLRPRTRLSSRSSRALDWLRRLGGGARGEQRPDVGASSVRRVDRAILRSVRDDGQESLDDGGVELPPGTVSKLLAGDTGDTAGPYVRLLVMSS